MKIEIPDIDLKDLLEKNLKTAFSPESMEKIIVENINATIKTAVGEQFKWNGNMKTKIEEVVKQKLDFDLSKIDVPSYNTIMINSIKDVLGGIEDTELKQKTQDLMDDIMMKAPREYKFSKLVEDFKNHILENATLEHHEFGDAALEILEEEDTYSTKISVTLDEVCSIHQHKTGFEFHVSTREWEATTSQDIKKMDFYGTYVDGTRISSKVNFKDWGSYSEFEKTLYLLTENGIEIEFDMDTADDKIYMFEEGY